MEELQLTIPNLLPDAWPGYGCIRCFLDPAKAVLDYIYCIQDYTSIVVASLVTALGFILDPLQPQNAKSGTTATSILLFNEIKKIVLE